VVVAFIPAAFALVAVQRPRLALLTATWLVTVCWFAASYTNASIERYYLGPVLIAIVWLGVAAGLIVERLRDAPVGRRAAALLGLCLAVGLVLPAALAAPATASRVDLRGDTRAADWSRWALAAVGQDAVIVSWWSFSTPLWYRTLVLGERPDVRVLDDRDRLDEELGGIDDVIRANLGARPVYLVRNPGEIAALETTWLLEVLPDPLGLQPLYRVAGARPRAIVTKPTGSASRMPP
jgi:hypothetical protein